jgi:hypothetical protein
MAKKQSTTEVSNIIEVATSTVVCCVLGTSPLVLNRLSEKAQHELLLPKGRKNAVDKASSLKHAPLQEYRDSAHRISDPSAPTLLAVPATAFKGSLRTAALDMAGASKSQIGRLTYIAGEYVGVYGIPKLFMRAVRMADIGKTPDIRTRCIVPEWACIVAVTYVQPLIRQQAVVNLLAAAGITVGVGDGRQEKGATSFGQFRLVSEKDAEFKAIVKGGARKVQMDAMERPVCYDDQSTELLSWYDSELARRQMKGVA